MVILTYIFSCFYFFLPAYFANMTPPLIRKAGIFKFLDSPVDFGRTFFGQPIFGSHKTWRGTIFGIIIGILVVLIQYFLYQSLFIKRISLIDYQKINLLLFGFLISFGAVFGDLIFAFIKRRLRIKPGAPFIPFDQINYVIGTIIFLTPFFKAFKIEMINCYWSFCDWWEVWLTIFILTFILHIIFNRLGYFLKISRAKW